MLPADPADRVARRDHRIGVPGGRLFAREWTPLGPEAPPDARAPLLLFHDSLGSVDLWRDFPARLATTTGRRVIAYDRLGLGRSDPFPGRLPLTFVDDEATAVVPRLREALGLERLVALGHSVGGAMAVATAARLGDACEALVTIAAQSFVEERTLDGVRAARAAFADPERVRRLERHHGDKARWVLDAWIETWLDPAFAGWNLDAALGDVRCPTLALHGDRDEYGSVEQATRIAREVRGPARVVILEECGHVPQREQSARVLAEIGRLLAKATPSS